VGEEKVAWASGWRVVGEKGEVEEAGRFER
jgi:hypothetical protein